MMIYYLFYLIFHLSIILLQSKEILYSTHPLMMLTHHLREMKKSEIQNIYICCQFSFDAVFSCSRTIILMQFDPSYDASESDWALCCRVLQRCKFLLRFIPRILQVKDSYHDIYNKVWTDSNSRLSRIRDIANHFMLQMFYLPRTYWCTMFVISVWWKRWRRSLWE